jgi:hypothetical protein
MATAGPAVSPDRSTPPEREVIAVEHSRTPRVNDGRYVLRLECGHALPVPASEATAPPLTRPCPGCADPPLGRIRARHRW